MVILLQTYNGNNPYNNNVIVDYIKKSVVFEPLKDSGILKQYYLFFNQLFMKGLMISLIAGMPLFLLNDTWKSFLVIFGLITLFSFVFSLNFFREEWRKNWLPKVYHGINFYHTKYKKINPLALIDNKFIIPCFDNVMLQYKAYGDFATHLKKIEIRNLYEDDKFNFFCIFSFKKKVNEGYLKIKYV